MPSPEAFYFSDGSAAETLAELKDILRVHHDVDHHITDEKNDFANWIRYVHHDEELARKVEKCRSTEQVVVVLEEALAPPLEAQKSLTDVIEPEPLAVSEQDILPEAPPQMMPPKHHKKHHHKHKVEQHEEAPELELLPHEESLPLVDEPPALEEPEPFFEPVAEEAVDDEPFVADDTLPEEAMELPAPTSPITTHKRVEVSPQMMPPEAQPEEAPIETPPPPPPPRPLIPEPRTTTHSHLRRDMIIGGVVGAAIIVLGYLLFTML